MCRISMTVWSDVTWWRCARVDIWYAAFFRVLHCSAVFQRIVTDLNISSHPYFLSTHTETNRACSSHTFSHSQFQWSLNLSSSPILPFLTVFSALTHFSCVQLLNDALSTTVITVCATEYCPFTMMAQCTLGSWVLILRWTWVDACICAFTVMGR